MKNPADFLGIQTWSLRKFSKTRDVIARVRELGLKRVELYPGHADFDNPDGFDDIIAAYQDAGIKIVCIGVMNFGVEEAAARRRFEFARKAGFNVISGGFEPATFLAALPIVYRLCEEYGVTIAIHNHGGYHWLGNGDILKWVFSITRPCIGLHMDTGWTLDARENPVEWAKTFAERLFAIHIKDQVYDRARNSTDVVVGTGNLKLQELVDQLKADGFNGEAIIEYGGTEDDPMPAMAKSIEAISKAW